MSDSVMIAGMGTIIVAVFGIVWGLMRGEITELKARVIAGERDLGQLKTEHARSEERDKSFDAGIARLTKAIDDFDSRIGAQIEQLTRVVDSMTRRYTPSGGTPKPRTSYKFIPNDNDEEKK